MMRFIYCSNTSTFWITERHCSNLVDVLDNRTSGCVCRNIFPDPWCFAMAVAGDVVQNWRYSLQDLLPHPAHGGFWGTLRAEEKRSVREKTGCTVNTRWPDNCFAPILLVTGSPDQRDQAVEQAKAHIMLSRSQPASPHAIGSAGWKWSGCAWPL